MVIFVGDLLPSSLRNFGGGGSAELNRRSMPITQLICCLGLLVGLALFGCTSQSSSDVVEAQQNHPPSTRVAMILPDPIVLGEPVRLYMEGHDLDGDPVTFRQQWFVNGTLVPGENGTTLPSEYMTRGARVEAEVVPSDGKTEGLPSRAIQVVANTLPVVVRVAFEPYPIHIGSRIRAAVDASDADRDEVQLTYKWWRNGKLVKEGMENDLDITGFARKDMIAVEVTPSDRVGKGKPFISDPVQIGNAPPQIVSMPASTIEAGRYEHMLKVIDPDGDSVTFTLETAPHGMMIDKTTGQIVWKIPADLTGTHRVRVVVHDGQGGSSFQEFELALSPPPAAS